MATIVVLNDGETWTTIEGCKMIHGLSDEQLDDLQAGEIRVDDLKDTGEDYGIHIQDMSNW